MKTLFNKLFKRRKPPAAEPGWWRIEVTAATRHNRSVARIRCAGILQKA